MAGSATTGGTYSFSGAQGGNFESLNIILDTTTEVVAVKAAQTDKQIGLFSLWLVNKGANTALVQILSGTSIRLQKQMAAAAVWEIPLTANPQAVTDVLTALNIKATGTTPDVIGTVVIGVGAKNTPFSLQ